MGGLGSLAARFEQMPDTPGWFDRHLSSPWRQFLVLLALGLILRGATFGDPNLHIDDAFYSFVAQEMHHGALPYVDVWDRKPLGLFLIYYAATAISPSPVSYQVAAWVAVTATAVLISRIVGRWTRQQGALLAAVLYLFMLGIVEGYGGQAPVFYNLLIAGACLLILQAFRELAEGRAGWRPAAAMALCGLALTVKQTTIFEAAWFGLFAAWTLWSGGAGLPRTTRAVALWMVIGALPSLAIAITYAAIGHWSEFWQAMVTANSTRAHWPLLDIAIHALVMLLRLYPLIALAVLGLFVTDRAAVVGRDRAFLLGWLGAATLGMLAVPNFYGHYALPLLVPLCIASGPVLGRRDIGVFLAVLVAAFALLLYNPFDLAERRKSALAMERLARDIVAHDGGGGLFVSDGPVYLHTMSGKRPLTPLAFPPHLNEIIETDVSQFKTHEEVRRVLARGPGVVVLTLRARHPLTNGDTRALTLNYVHQSCRLSDIVTVYEVDWHAPVAVWGDCHAKAAKR